MSSAIYDQIVQLAAQLNDSERSALIQQLQSTALGTGRITRDMILDEHARRVAAGDFKNLRSLRNRWAQPDLDISEEELEASLREISTEWEKDINEPVDKD